MPELGVQIEQVIFAMERAQRDLQQRADSLCDQHDYSAEFPASDAECMAQGIAILRQMLTKPMEPIESDPMTAPLPCDVRIGGMKFCKGVALRSLVDAMKRRLEPRPGIAGSAYHLPELGDL